MWTNGRRRYGVAPWAGPEGASTFTFTFKSYVVHCLKIKGRLICMENVETNYVDNSLQKRIRSTITMYMVYSTLAVKHAKNNC